MGEIGQPLEQEPILSIPFRDVLIDMPGFHDQVQAAEGKLATFVHPFFQQTDALVLYLNGEIPWMAEPTSPASRVAEQVRLNAFKHGEVEAIRAFQDAGIPVLLHIEPDLRDGGESTRTPEIFERAVYRTLETLQSYGYTVKPGDPPLNMILSLRSDPAPLPLADGRSSFGSDQEEVSYVSELRDAFAVHLAEGAGVKRMWIAGGNLGGDAGVFGPSYPSTNRGFGDPIAQSARRRIATRSTPMPAGKSHPQVFSLLEKLIE